jgi:hypothetical protein
LSCDVLAGQYLLPAPIRRIEYHNSKIKQPTQREWSQMPSIPLARSKTIFHSVLSLIYALPKRPYAMQYNHLNSIQPSSLLCASLFTTTPHLLLSPSTITTNHLPQLVFLREFPAQYLEIGNKGFAAVDQCFFRGDIAVSLDAEFEGCEEGVRDYPHTC